MSDYPPTPLKRLELDTDLVREQTASSLLLVKEVFSMSGEKNAVLSPLSIHIVLSMLAAGAAWPVKEWILSFLRANSVDQLHSFASQVVSKVFADRSASGGPKLSAANAVWIKDTLTFKSPFKQVVETHYKAVTKQLDFNKVDEAVREVNEWAEKETNGLIKNVVDKGCFTPLTVLVLANALYFKGAWCEPFDPRKTKENVFHLGQGSSCHVPFMTSKEDQHIGTYHGFKVLQLHYKLGDFFGEEEVYRSYSMCIFLPNDRDGLPALLKRACSEHEFLNRHIPNKSVKVGEFRIPKFKIELQFEDVLDVLEKLGLQMGLLEEMATEWRNVRIDKIIHKAVVEVNEQGTEAAAVTVAVGYGCCMPKKPPQYVDFVADHPFMFVIRENISGLVLFVGQVLNPENRPMGT